MQTDDLALLLYLTPVLILLVWYVSRQRQAEARNRVSLQESLDTGMTEPASLHPVINPALCIGCGSCVSACPEGDVLGLIKRKAVLITPSECIGHGACKAACPQGAIELVIGTESRGVEIPVLTPAFETSVPGIFVAGELGGMGLVKNAVEQGQQAMQSIARQLASTSRHDPDDPSADTTCLYDVVIVGAGPAGISAALEAQSRSMKVLVIDRSKVGGTVAHFPRQKLVMTAPVILPGVGKVHFREIQKEDLIAFWQKTVTEKSLPIHENETLTDIRPQTSGFEVITDQRSCTTRFVLLAMGRRGTPRKLGVPGEELHKVAYELDDPAQYAGQQMLVVGGGDSAVEAAVSLAEHSPGKVTLAYRGDAFNRAKKKNRDRLDAAVSAGNLQLLTRAEPARITSAEVILTTAADEAVIPNDFTIVCAGGVLPTPFLRDIGIHIETRHGQV
ncbi:MAG: NAD(P)-binding domain-containing protein [Pseudomonadales bacterium]|nr:NAD(P)-binding domain-containing protein [Pseudomonadales bacterium]